jgi:hypothetical protein
MAQTYKLQVIGTCSGKWFDLDGATYYEINETAANQQLEILKAKAGNFFRAVKLTNCLFRFR